MSTENEPSLVDQAINKAGRVKRNRYHDPETDQAIFDTDTKITHESSSQAGRFWRGGYASASDGEGNYVHKGSTSADAYLRPERTLENKLKADAVVSNKGSDVTTNYKSESVKVDGLDSKSVLREQSKTEIKRYDVDGNEVYSFTSKNPELTDKIAAVAAKNIIAEASHRLETRGEDAMSRRSDEINARQQEDIAA